MKKIKFALGIALLAATIATGCNNKPKKECLPTFIHTGFSDSLAAQNHNISYTEVKEMVARFKNSRKDSIEIPNCGVFNREAIYNSINRDSVVGVAIFNGLTTNNKMKQILIPVKGGGVLDTMHCEEKSLTPPNLTVGP